SGSSTAVSASTGVSVTSAGSGDTRFAIFRRPASITAFAAGLSVTALYVPAICSYRRRPAFEPRTEPTAKTTRYRIAGPLPDDGVLQSILPHKAGSAPGRARIGGSRCACA